MEADRNEKNKKKFLDNIKVESALNKGNNELPYGYHNPETEGKLVWICGRDAEGRITSVFQYDFGTHKDKKCDYLDSIEKAKEIRKELIDAGWKPVDPPKITFSFSDDGEKKDLNRKQLRALKKRVKQLEKRNPFRNAGGAEETLPPPPKIKKEEEKSDEEED